MLLALVLAAAVTQAPLTVDVEALAGRLPLPTPTPRASVSAAWILAPAACHAVDLGTALWADAHRWDPEGGHAHEANGFLSTDGHMRARGVAIKTVGTAVLAVGGTYVLGRVLHHPAGRTGAKAFAATSCGVALAGASTNVGLWHP